MDMVNISVGTAATIVILGMAVVFLGLIMLMLVIQLMSKFFIRKQAKARAEAEEKAASPADVPAPVKADLAPGTAGECKLYDTDPRTAAIIMAIVADELKTPLNELRFKSIKEVRE
ncbi:MAG: OadG family protein [Oscillospiraceae bacterium]|nr:OadG family protein [Oscillospiraceae bacterium]